MGACNTTPEKAEDPLQAQSRSKSAPLNFHNGTDFKDTPPQSDRNLEFNRSETDPAPPKAKRPTWSLQACDDIEFQKHPYIQPHGVVLIIDRTPPYTVRRISTNALTCLPEATLQEHDMSKLMHGKVNLEQLLGPAVCGQFAEWFVSVASDPLARTQFPIRLGLKCSCNAQHDMSSCAICPIPGAPNELCVQFTSVCLPRMKALETCYNAIVECELDTVEATLARACEQIRMHTGFVRVVTYKFHPDLHGEVVAGSVGEGVDSFDGLHFPAADIPVHARRLYKTNIIRCIADVNAEPIPVIPVEQGKLDLGECEIRASHPVHIRYTQNLGVASTMTVSIIVHDKLWGLLICHHTSMLQLSSVEQQKCHAIVKVLGDQLSKLLAASEQADRDAITAILAAEGPSDSIPNAPWQNGSAIQSLCNKETLGKLCELMEAKAGVVLSAQHTDGKKMKDLQLTVHHALGFDGQIALNITEYCHEVFSKIADGDSLYSSNFAVDAAETTTGQLEAEESWMKLWKYGKDRLFVRRDAPVEDGTAAAAEIEVLAKSAATLAELLPGVLLLRLGESLGLMFFRENTERVVMWAGKPAKAHDAEKGVQPRLSFAPYLENVKNRSLDWNDVVLQRASFLQRSLFFILLSERLEIAAKGESKLSPAFLGNLSMSLKLIKENEELYKNHEEAITKLKESVKALRVKTRD
jgi:light-regulated signal transduction histidine kinase (bacteriophytochrome)